MLAVDTNILIYLHDSSSPAKKSIAQNILSDNPCVPAQVISEYLNITRRILNLSKDDLLIQTSGLLVGCSIIPVATHTLSFAATLVKQYKFQLFDAVIVAAAIEGECRSFIQKICTMNLLSIKA
jgi:predicted nucleic acid-binding protein